MQHKLDEPFQATSNKPKMLFLHQGGELYGSDIIFYQVVQAAARYVDPVVILSEPGPLFDRLRGLTGNVSIRQLGVLRRQHFNLRGAVWCAFHIMRAAFEIATIVRKEGVQAIYSNTIGVLPGAVAAKLTGVPHIWHIHEIIVKPRWLSRVLAAFTALFSTSIIVVSRAVADHLASVCWKTAAKIKVIYNGLPLDAFEEADGYRVRREFGLSEESVLICMVGRINLLKGQDCLIDAVNVLRGAGLTDFKVLIVGDTFRGNEWIRSRLEDKVRSLNLEDTVIFTGYRTDVPAIIRGADLVVVPSVLADSLPTVALETMACSKPIVASRVGGLTEIVEDGVTGYLVQPNDPKALADKIMLLAKNKELREAVGKAGKARFTKVFSLERFRTEIQRVILETITRTEPKVNR